AAGGNPIVRAQLRLSISLDKGVAHTHHFAGGFHFRTENRIYRREFIKREHGFFYAEIIRDNFFSETLRFQRRSRLATRCYFSQRYTDTFGYKWHGARCARIDFDDINLAILIREL